ncbi:PQQ-binding-like beta-propeller repeat protein [Paenibacillus sp. FSL R7-0345]|uniref:outer membrane protein assembly factor BamB family protein n=1 Tax=Paenibacillus sp. FSL R7-0345 TaxID=2954535 RepID=UPI00315A4333
MSKTTLGLALLLAAGLLTYGIATASHGTDSSQNSQAPKVTSAAALTEATPTPAPTPTQTPAADIAQLQVLWQADSDSSGMYADEQTAANGQIYYSNHNTLYAASIDSGKVLWNYNKGRYPEIISDNSVYMISSSDHLVKLSADTGKQLWSTQVANQPMEVGGHASMIGETIIFANESGGVAAYDPDTGKQLWSNPDVPMYAGSIHGEHKGVLIVSSTIDNIRWQISARSETAAQ